MKRLNLNHLPVLLDGGMGRELRSRGIDILRPSWSAYALLSDPDVVRQVHSDYIEAGADIITTNTYGIIRTELAKEGLEDRFDDQRFEELGEAGEYRVLSDDESDRVLGELLGTVCCEYIRVPAAPTSCFLVYDAPNLKAVVGTDSTGFFAIISSGEMTCD